jgi:hypothetical protein
MFTTGDSFFDGPEVQAMKGPFIGGGLTLLGKAVVRKFVPSMAEHAGLIGMAIGGGVSAYMMTQPAHKEAGAAGLATALLIGLPSLIDKLAGTTLFGDDMNGLGAYAQEMGASGLELMAPADGIQIQDSGSGSTGLIGAVTQEMGAYSQEMGAPAEGISIQGSDFGSVGF